MQNTKVLSLIGLLMVGLALATNYGMARVSIPTAHHLPVETFPRRIGEWTAGPDLAADEAVQRRLPTATLVTRIYTNAAGESVQLLLLTAGRREDFHNPNECFPGQGWQLTEQRQFSLDGQQVNTMMADRDSISSEVWYWWAGDLDFAQQSGKNIPALQKLRRKIYAGLGRADGMSLFVRMMAPHTVQGHQSLNAFTRAALPSIQFLESAGDQPPQVVRK